MNVVAYPVANKRKATEICEAFAQGCGGGVVRDGVFHTADAHFFYGVDASNEAAWRAVRKARAPYYYCDNAYFDQVRGQYFRVTRNGLQHNGVGRSNGKRFNDLGIEMRPWRQRGDHVVVCPQSEHFMRTLAGVDFDWTRTTLSALARFTSRPVRLREWSRDKAALAATLDDDLRGAHALVTWSSAAAVMAVTAGVPVVTMGPCAAAPMAGDLADIENLPQPERMNWASVLADNQWTLEEMKSGRAWEGLLL